jgi:hypothetical protein
MSVCAPISVKIPLFVDTLFVLPTLSVEAPFCLHDVMPSVLVVSVLPPSAIFTFHPTTQNKDNFYLLPHVEEWTFNHNPTLNFF